MLSPIEHSSSRPGAPSASAAPPLSGRGHRRGRRCGPPGGGPSAAARVLGGGSNLVVADEGVDGLVLKIAPARRDARGAAGAVEVTAAAGEPWDELVAARWSAAGGARVFERDSRPRRRHADPERGRLRPGGGRDDRRVRVLDRARGGVVNSRRPSAASPTATAASRARAPGRFVVLAVSYRLRRAARRGALRRARSATSLRAAARTVAGARCARR